MAFETSLVSADPDVDISAGVRVRHFLRLGAQMIPLIADVERTTLSCGDASSSHEMQNEENDADDEQNVE